MILTKQHFCSSIGLSSLLVGVGPAQAWVHAGSSGGGSICPLGRWRQLRLGGVLPLRQHHLWGGIEHSYRRLRRHDDENGFRIGHPKSKWNDILFRDPSTRPIRRPTARRRRRIKRPMAWLITAARPPIIRTPPARATVPITGPRTRPIPQPGARPTTARIMERRPILPIIRRPP